MIVHCDGVEQRKTTIRGRMVWKMREDRAMGPNDRTKTIGVADGSRTKGHKAAVEGVQI
jgi:hypothetical protein